MFLRQDWTCPRCRYWNYVDMVMKNSLIKVRNFLTNLLTISFQRRAVCHWISNATVNFSCYVWTINFTFRKSGTEILKTNYKWRIFRYKRGNNRILGKNTKWKVQEFQWNLGWQTKRDVPQVCLGKLEIRIKYQLTILQVCFFVCLWFVWRRDT